MNNIKVYLIDFAEGRISVPDFIEHCKTNPNVLDFLTSIAGPEQKLYTHRWVVDDNGIGDFVHDEVPYDARISLQQHLQDHCGTLEKHLNIHSVFSNIVARAFPDEKIEIDKTLSIKYSFMLDACPEYIGGIEVDALLEDLLNSLPENLSKTKRIKQYKDQVKVLFHLDGGKYPRWVQSPEWPLSDSGKPMRFVEQKRKKGKEYANMLFTQYVFEDVDTGEKRTVEQFT